jgi:putative nucleotidyltransferase with HDIG domain
MALPSQTAASRIPDRLAKVPSFPPIAVKVLQLLANPDVNLKNVLELINSDAALSARLLQYANSPVYGVSGQITSVAHALTMLGIDQVKGATATAAAGIFMKGKLSVDELRRCWVHTLACAVLSDELARACNVHVEEAYTAGLIHDIGRLSLVVAYPQEYVAAMREASARCIDLIDFEREEFGLDHAEAGRWLIEKWGLPHEFGIIAGRHHDEPDTVETNLLTLVHLACRLADSLGFEVTVPLRPVSMEELLSSLGPAVRSRLPATEEELRQRVLRRVCSFDGGESEIPESLKEAVKEEDDASEPVVEDLENESPPVPITRFWPVIVLLFAAFAGLLLVLRDTL